MGLAVRVKAWPGLHPSAGPRRGSVFRPFPVSGSACIPWLEAPASVFRGRHANTQPRCHLRSSSDPLFTYKSLVVELGPLARSRKTSLSLSQDFSLKKKILHLLRRQGLLPHKGRKPTGIKGKDVDVFGGGGGRYSATSSFRLHEHLLLHPFTLLPSLHLCAIYPPV